MTELDKNVFVLCQEKGYTVKYSMSTRENPRAEPIRVRIDPLENSVVAALGNTHGQESNTRRVFQWRMDNIRQIHCLVVVHLTCLGELPF